MNIRELKEFLSQFPEDTIVEVIGADEDFIRIIEFRGENYNDYEYTDLAGNSLIKPDSPHYNKKTILLGREY